MPVQTDAVLLPADAGTRSHHSFKFKHIQSHILLSINIRFFVRTVPELNSLPEACVNVDTVTAFQAQLRHTPWAVHTPPPIVVIGLRGSGLTIIQLELELELSLARFS